MVWWKQGAQFYRLCGLSVIEGRGVGAVSITPDAQAYSL